MFISASRRTDIPNYYSEWFYNRIKEKYLLVRNPMNIHQISKIDLSPGVVDGIVFWSKNPEPMIARLDELKDYNYYFQFTLNSYANDIEPNVPTKNSKVIPTFQKLSDKIGVDRVIWRYDPIFINNKYTVDYHIDYFYKLAKKLSDYTTKCTISFIDMYRNTARNMNELSIDELTLEQKIYFAKNLSKIAKEFGLIMDTCAENIDLIKYNIGHAKCIDNKLFEKLSGFCFDVKKDANQRLECGCIASIDIGMYNTCKNSCKYCYANYSYNTVNKNSLLYDPDSPLLCSKISNEDSINIRKVKSFRKRQISIFDNTN